MLFSTAHYLICCKNCDTCIIIDLVFCILTSLLLTLSRFLSLFSLSIIVEKCMDEKTWMKDSTSVLNTEQTQDCLSVGSTKQNEKHTSALHSAVTFYHT